MKGEVINIEKEGRIFNAAMNGGRLFDKKGKTKDVNSVFVDPFRTSGNSYANLRTVRRTQNGGVACSVLRNIAKKAWIINLCIGHTIKKATPFFKESSSENLRGFVFRDSKGKLATGEKKDELVKFLKNTGNYDDPNRDKFGRYCKKILRDLLTLDQVATELQYDKKGDICAFFAVDSGTIERVLPETKEKSQENFDYLQIVEGAVVTGYSADKLLFDFENPRTDIYNSMYGYSYVEQAIDLVTSVINTFMYNAGNFTDNKLPRGMLLLNGDVNMENVEQIGDYIAEIMSGGPLNQWRIPILPSGGKDNSIEWKVLNANREMEFQSWLDYLTAGVVSMFGCSVDELGLQINKSQAVFDGGNDSKLKASKSLVLGDVLGFLEEYINRIIEKLDTDLKFEFVGYEKDNPSTVADLDEKECRTWKAINEKREEKGYKKIDLSKIENPADLPMNVQLVQLFQSQQMNDQGEMDGGEEGEDDWADYEGTDEDNETSDYGEEESSLETDYGDTSTEEEQAENELKKKNESEIPQVEMPDFEKSFIVI